MVLFSGGQELYLDLLEAAVQVLDYLRCVN